MQSYSEGALTLGPVALYLCPPPPLIPAGLHSHCSSLTRPERTWASWFMGCDLYFYTDSFSFCNKIFKLFSGIRNLKDSHGFFSLLFICIYCRRLCLLLFPEFAKKYSVVLLIDQGLNLDILLQINWHHPPKSLLCSFCSADWKGLAANNFNTTTPQQVSNWWTDFWTDRGRLQWRRLHVWTVLSQLSVSFNSEVLRKWWNNQPEFSFTFFLVAAHPCEKRRVESGGEKPAAH